MKKFFTLLLCMSSVAAFSQAFTVGNLVVYRVGNGSATLGSTGTAVFLDEYTPTGTLVRSLALPTTASGVNRAFVASGSATSEGLLTRSANGLFLLATGYDAAPGTTGIASTTGAANNRVVATINNAGVINSATGISDLSTGNNVRSAVSADGINIYAAGGTGGIRYFQIVTAAVTGTSTAITSDILNIRGLGIFGGQLYATSGSGTTRLATVGTGLPTTTGATTTNIPGSPTNTSPYQFFYADLSTTVPGVDVLYVADDASTTGLQKYSLVSGTWVSNGNVTITGGGLRGLTGAVAGSNVNIYGATGSAIYSFADSTGYNGTLTGSFTSIATAATNTAFRGIAFAPTVIALPIQLSAFSASLVNRQAQLNWNTSSEVNFNHFSVEKSFNGTEFSEIASIASKSTTGAQYTYTDASKTLSTQYYRLKIVDNDGSFKYSNIVLVNGLETLTITAFPNPVINSISIVHPKAVKGATIQLVSNDGRVVGNYAVATGATQTSFNVSQFIPGNYQVIFQSNGAKQTVSLVKQ